MSKAASLRGFPALQAERAVKAALEEDLGLAGDITTQATVCENTRAEAAIVARAPGRIAGLQCAEAAFGMCDRSVKYENVIADGADAAPGQTLAHVSGPAAGILTGERVALNFLCHLSGIATATRAFANAVEGTQAHICCTRKTTPGLRALEKYAVRAGGGQNHRFGLFDAVLIKDNHIAAAGGIETAVKRVRAHAGHMIQVEVEVDTLEQLGEVLSLDVDAVLLDNMSLGDLTEAVRRANGKVLTEASGGVNLENVREIAETGVDLISVGSLTHSPKALDLGLDFLS
ncbi:MAG TPA: carboxylating nicotinate-nucleotide diphosphorylase [Rhizobiales bacterium]|nr:putative nicotinate-nucleotide pyrophosphorylase [carboxylating] [bacterium BMS3Bbin10]HDO52224.1 carboxylating nicotinate-nucleotide diphosphorylase [Hyphomicrobiales bacterium]